jgi:Transcriptional regulator
MNIQSTAICFVVFNRRCEKWVIIESETEAAVTGPFFDPQSTREEILAATYNALTEHGPRELTVKKIGEEFTKSPSLIYHHYDGKDDLLVDLLSYCIDHFEAAVSASELDGSPRDRLDGYVTAMVAPERLEADQSPSLPFLKAVIQLRTTAIHDDAYQKQFERSDRVLVRFLRSTVIDAARAEQSASTTRASPGDEVSPKAVAEMLQTVTRGGTLRLATTSDHGWVDDVRAEVDRYLDKTLPRVVTDDPASD